MLELDFKEPETFNGPDGKVYEIRPLRTRHMLTVYRRYLEKGEEVESYQEKDGKKLEKLQEEEAELFDKLLLCAIYDVKTGKPAIPHKKYMSSSIEKQLVKEIIKVTSERRDGIPLEETEK
jgi:hypothetical protein